MKLEGKIAPRRREAVRKKVPASTSLAAGRQRMMPQWQRSVLTSMPSRAMSPSSRTLTGLRADQRGKGTP